MSLALHKIPKIIANLPSCIPSPGHLKVRLNFPKLLILKWEKIIFTCPKVFPILSLYKNVLKLDNLQVYATKSASCTTFAIHVKAWLQ